MGEDSPIALRSPRLAPMFSLGQYVIIGLASTIYLVGAALLLAGRTVASISESETQQGLPGAAKASPYFCPASGKDPDWLVRRGAAPPGDGALPRPGARAQGFVGDPPFHPQANPQTHGPLETHGPRGRAPGHASERLLTAPICLN